MRIACPLSSANTLTSDMIEPPLLRIGSTSIGLAESNTSQTASARRNSAAGVGAANENVRFRPSLVRMAATTGRAGSPAVLGREPAWPRPRAPRRGRHFRRRLGQRRRAFPLLPPPASAVRTLRSSLGASACFGRFGASDFDASDFGGSETGDVAGAVSGLISILASLANVSEVGGTIGAACCGGAGGSASFAARSARPAAASA